MKVRGIFRSLGRRIQRLHYGGDLVAKHEINRQVTIYHLTNPFSIYFAFRSETSGCILSESEASQVARLLERIVEAEHQGVAP
jgi:hypothetical protein